MKKIISTVLTFVLIVSLLQLAVPMTISAGQSNNVIGNNCSSISFADPKNVSYEPGTEGNVLLAQEATGATPYGPSLSVAPLTTSGGNREFEVFIDPTDANMANIQGIAFYVKVPNVSVQTAMEVRLIASNDAYWFTLAEGKPIHYLQTGSTQIQTINFSAGNYTYPVNNKGGWDGFVFIPFDSYVSQSGDRAKFEAAKAGELRLRINLANGNDSALTNQKYYFDEFGLYSDITSYATLASSLDGTSAAATNVIGNNCSSISFSDPKNVSYEPGVEGNVLLAQEPTGSSPYGPSLAVTPLTTTGGNGNFEVFINPTGANMSNVQGIAFYVKVPNVSAQTAMEVRLIASNDAYWFTLAEGKPIYYLQTGSSQVETINFSAGNYTYPVNNKGGWDGFVFIPFDSYVSQSGDRAKFEAAKAGELRLRINLANGNDSALTNQKYIFDEFGLYSDAVTYAALAKTLDGATSSSSSGNHIGHNCDNVSFSDPKNVSYEPGVEGNVLLAQQPSGVTPYGAALAVTPLTTTGGNGNFEVFIDPTGANMSSVLGIAFYVKVPNVSAQTAMEVRLIATNDAYWFNLREGAPIYYLQTGSTQVETVTFSDSNYTYPVNNKGGWDGFVFIPFDSYVTQSGDRAKFEAAPAGQLRLRINLANGNDSALTNQKYIFDEFGLCSDIVSYAALAKSLDGTSTLPSSVTSSQYEVTGSSIHKIPSETSIDALLAGINESLYCKIYKGSNNVVGSSFAGTGMTLKIEDGSVVSATYTIIVTGDTNGDGKTTVTDMIAIKAHILSKTDLEGSSLTAADTSGDSKVTITDFIQVKAKILNKGNITAR